MEHRPAESLKRGLHGAAAVIAASQVKSILKSSTGQLPSADDPAAAPNSPPPSSSAATDDEDSDAKKPRLKWDEDNLQITSAERGTRTKIMEPKTPYVHYDPTTDSVLNGSGDFVQLPPFALNEALAAYREEDMINAGIRHASIHSPASNSTDNLPAGGGSLAKREWDSSDSEPDMSSSRRHEEFELKRQHHYKMKEALLLGRKLSFDADDDDDENRLNGNDTELDEMAAAAMSGESLPIEDTRTTNGGGDQWSQTGMYGDSDTASRLSLDLHRQEMSTSCDDNANDEDEEEEDDDDDYEHDGARPRSGIDVGGQSVSSSSSQLRLYVQQPAKPALVTSQSHSSTTAVADDDSATSSSRRDKHVRIVDSRSRRVDIISSVPSSPGAGRT